MKKAILASILVSMSAFAGESATLSCWSAANYNGHDVDTRSEPMTVASSTGHITLNGAVAGVKDSFFQVEFEPDGSARAVLWVGKMLEGRKAYAAVETVVSADKPLKITAQADDKFVSVLCRVSTH